MAISMMEFENWVFYFSCFLKYAWFTHKLHRKPKKCIFETDVEVLYYLMAYET